MLYRSSVGNGSCGPQYHTCPCDVRCWGGHQNSRSTVKKGKWRNGCFYTCAVFNKLWPVKNPHRTLTLDEIKDLYDRLIVIKEKELANEGTQ